MSDWISGNGGGSWPVDGCALGVRVVSHSLAHRLYPPLPPGIKTVAPLTVARRINDDSAQKQCEMIFQYNGACSLSKH